MPAEYIGIHLITPANSFIAVNASVGLCIFTLQLNLASFVPAPVPSSTSSLAYLEAAKKLKRSTLEKVKESVD